MVHHAGNNTEVLFESESLSKWSCDLQLFGSKTITNQSMICLIPSLLIYSVSVHMELLLKKGKQRERIAITGVSFTIKMIEYMRRMAENIKEDKKMRRQ